MNIHLGNLAVVALLLTAFILLLHKGRNTPLPNATTFRSVFSYYIALQLLIYGLDKVFGNQFYFPEPNTLYTPLGFLDKDILYWSTIATSKMYLMATGLIETIAALLLIFRRTRYLGGILALAALGHVLIINFGFNISVKLHSLLLCCITLFVVWPALKALWKLFIGQKKIELQWPKPEFDNTYHLVKHILSKGLVVFFIVFEAGGPHALGTDNGNDTYLNEIVGAYEVVHQTTGAYSDGLCGLDSTKYLTDSIQRVFFHSQNYFITQQGGTFKDHQISDYGIGFDWLIGEGRLSLIACENPGFYSLRWHIEDHNTNTLLLRKIDLKKLPAAKDDFHWFMEPYSR